MKILIIFIIFLFYLIYELNAICGEHENSEWKLKGTNCGKFCADLLNPEKLCNPRLFHLGCFCKDGYYRDKNLHCVLPDECGKEILNDSPSPSVMDCPNGEAFDNCSSRCLEMCKNREDPISCPINCDTGCFCRGTQLRNDAGVCVQLDQCEPLVPDRPRPICPSEEMYLKCGNRCQELCPTTQKSFGMSLECNECEKGCFCVPGVLRGQSGVCVEKRNCDKKSVVTNILSSIFNVVFPKNGPRKMLG